MQNNNIVVEFDNVTIYTIILFFINIKGETANLSRFLKVFFLVLNFLASNLWVSLDLENG